MKIKRVIGVITVFDNIAVQSFGYDRYLPLGDPSVLAENLDRWGADEILMVDVDATKKKSGPNLELLDNLKSINLSTPLIYGGGIRNKKDAISVIQNGADRILVETLADTNPSEVLEIAEQTGKQAIIRGICIKQKNNTRHKYNYISRNMTKIVDNLDEVMNEESCSELMIADVENEGEEGMFNSELIQGLNKRDNVIVYGGVGVGQRAKELLTNDTVCAIAIGNQLNYTEESIYNLKTQFSEERIRKTISGVG